MTLIIGSLVWIFVVAMLLVFIRGAGQQRHRPAWLSIRASDRLYSRRPNLMFAVMLFIFCVILYAAYKADVANTDTLRWQMATNTRGSA